MALSTVSHNYAVTAKGSVEDGLPLGGGLDDDEGVPWGIRSKVWQQVRKLQKKDKHKDRRINLTRALMGGLDPDIACLQSLPYTTQVRMQVERCIQEDKKEEGVLSHVARLFGVDPEKLR